MDKRRCVLSAVRKRVAKLNLVADDCVRALDHEIFRLRDELELNEGKDVSFYGESIS